MRVAIVGAGIGGLTAAYYLSKHADIHIDLYEKDRIGGRIFTNHGIDQGAEYFVSSNFKLLKLLAQLNEENLNTNLQLEEYLSKRAFYVDNKSAVLPLKGETSLRKLSDYMKLLIYTGFDIKSLKITNKLIDEFEIKLQNIFKMDNEERYTVYKHLLTNNFEDYLISRGVSKKFINKFVDPLIAPIYMTPSSQLLALHGALLLAAKNNEIYHVRDGNQRIVHALHEYLNEQHNVSIIHKEVRHISSSNTIDHSTYDFIYLALPHPQARKISVDLDEFKVYRMMTKKSAYRELYHHLIEGELQPKLQKLFDKGVSTVFTGSTQDIFEINRVDKNVYDITSLNPYNQTNIGNYFTKYKLIYEKHWKYAYPEFTVSNLENLPKNGYINSSIAVGTEFLASSLETVVSNSIDIVNLILQQQKSEIVMVKND